MTRIALISGAHSRVSEVSSELKRAGLRPVLTTRRRPLQTASVDAYVQLPIEAVEGVSCLDAVRALLTRGLLARLDALDEVLPFLRPDAVIVLVAGNTLADPHVPDAPRARLDLLRLLAQAVNQEHKVHAVVIDPYASAEDIASVVTGRSRLHSICGRIADLPPELSYTDWLREVLSYTSGIDQRAAMKP